MSYNLIYSTFIRTMVIYQNRFFDLGWTTVMNPKNSHGNHHESPYWPIPPKHNNGVGLQSPNWQDIKKWKLFLSFLPLFGKSLVKLLKNSQEPLIFNRWNFMNTAFVVVKPWVRLTHKDHEDLILQYKCPTTWV
jgi:hypothetical protein